MFKGFSNIFKDNNDINEKSIVGFIFLIIFIGIVILDYCGFPANHIILDSIILIMLSCFGISASEKIFVKRGVNGSTKSSIKTKV
jgi:hypothetical protein